MTDKIVCWKHFHRQMICFGGFMINQSNGRNFFCYKFFDDYSVSFSFLAICYLFCIPPLYIWFFFIWDAVQLCQRRPIFVATLATPHTLVGIFCIFRKIWLFWVFVMISGQFEIFLQNAGTSYLTDAYFLSMSALFTKCFVVNR